MALVLTCSDTEIRIKVSGATESQSRVKLGQSLQKSLITSGLMLERGKCCVGVVLTNFDLQLTFG